MYNRYNSWRKCTFYFSYFLICFHYPNSFAFTFYAKKVFQTHLTCNSPKLYWDSVAGSRWQCRKILNSPPLVDTTNLQLHIGIISPERVLKTRWRGPPQQRIKGPYQDARRGRNVLLPKTRSQAQQHITRRDLNDRKLFLRSEWFVPYIRSPNSWILHWRDQPPKHKTNRDCVQENYRTVGNGEPTLKGMIHRLTHAGTQHKSRSLKSTWVICEGDLLIKFRICGQRAGICWNLLHKC